jgi:hypothetical protein
MPPTNMNYHIEDSGGLLFELPRDARPSRVQISNGRTIQATPESDVWWLEGKNKIKPYFLELSWVQQGGTFDEVRYALIDLYDRVFAGVRLWRDIQWYRDIHPQGDFDIAPQGTPQ